MHVVLQQDRVVSSGSRKQPCLVISKDIMLFLLFVLVLLEKLDTGNLDPPSRVYTSDVFLLVRILTVVLHDLFITLT